MKNIARYLRQTLSLVLVLSMLFTSVPVQAFAAEAPVPRIPVSAPLEQPEPVDYEAQQQAADESGGASASTPDSTPAESAPPVSSSVSQTASSSQSASAETPESSSVPSSGSNAQPSGDSSTAPESVSTPDASSSVSESAGVSTSTSEVNSEEDSSSSVETPAEETPEEPPVELRAPILREKYDPYAEKYGAPVEVSEYARVFSAPSANLFRAARGSAARKEYITVISPVPNTYVDENGQESDMYAATYNEEGRLELHVTLRSETSGVRTWRLYLDGNFKSEATAVLQ